MKYGVIGKNIDYSLSPIIHSANFASLNIEASYDIINSDNISREIEKLRQFSGFNVTIPYKEVMMNLCDDIDDDAKTIQAVNCVKVFKDQFHGYNTDIFGFYMLLKNNHLLDLGNLNVLIIGAGGASKAVYHCFEKYTDYFIFLTNRTIEKALNITNHVLTYNEAQNRLNQFDIIVNATSVGVSSYDSPISITKIKNNAVFIDVNYKNTKFLLDAKLNNAKTINGLDMLVYQAAKSFEIWFNKEANVNIMKKSLRKD